MSTFNIPTPQTILSTVHYITKKTAQTFHRNGVELEKGAVITSRRIDRHLDLYKKYCEFWTIYPDRYIALITPTTSKFKLKFFQIIFLRACLRHGRILTIAPRAAGKSFICLLAMYLICMFRPGSHVFQCANSRCALLS